MDVGAPSSTGLPGAGGRRGVSLRPVDRGRSGHRRRSRDGCGELAKLEMHPAIELLALLARVVAQRPSGPLLTILIRVSRTPGSTRERVTALGRAWARPPVYPA